LKYRVEWSSRATRELRKIPKQDHSAILDKVGSFGEEPRPTASRHIVAVPGAYRIRVGKWRIAYYVFETPRRVVIHSVQRRNESTYRRWRQGS
jgi:mRNA-degrading endonuclease RelE of RelBE toxin-antitoxin system